jgi:hypothetical protein
VKNRAVVVFTDAGLHRQLKTRCVSEGQTMTAVVEALVRGWLEAEAAVDAAVEAMPEQPRTAKSGAREPLGLEVSRRPELATLMAAGPTTTPVCRRCGHTRGAHWVKGCLAGCGCSDQRYLAEAEG